MIFCSVKGEPVVKEEQDEDAEEDPHPEDDPIAEEAPEPVERPLSPKTINKKGQIVHKRERIIIVNLYKDLKEENPEICKTDAYAVLSKRTGYGVSTIRKTMTEYLKKGYVTSPNTKKRRVTINQKINECDRNAIRKIVQDFYTNYKELPTLAKVLKAVNDDKSLPNFKRSNFWKLLKEMNLNKELSG